MQEALGTYRNLDYSIGFIPTMGALHQGHLSLVRLSRSENQITVVSVFVNPTQFNDPGDLKKYPRMPEQDSALLENEGVDFLYMPEVEDVYPDSELNKFDLGGLDQVMEGKFRPGHFSGVADVVYRLFQRVSPHKAYFGEKDYQQLKIIQRMVDVSGLSVEVKSGEIIREADGLAMSSRNMRLSEEQRNVAPNIYREMRSFDFSGFSKNPSAAEKTIGGKN